MIDTITLSTHDTDRLNTDKWPSTQTRTLGNKLVIKKAFNTDDLQATYTSHGVNQGRIAIQASLPKLIHGHNILDLGRREIILALEVLEGGVVGLFGSDALPPLEKWKVARLDWCHTWRVGSPSLYISDIYKSIASKKAEFLDLKHNARHGGMTLHIGTQSTRFARLYDKEAEVKASLRKGAVNLRRAGLDAEGVLDLSQGCLRFESVEKPQGLRKLIGPERTVNDLLACRSAFVQWPLRKRWREIVSSAWSPCEHSVAVERIIRQHSAKKARRIADRYAHVSMLGAETYRRLFEVESENWRRWKVELREAGVFLGADTSLDPLAVPGCPYEIDPANVRVRARRPWGFDVPNEEVDGVPEMD